MSEKNKTPKRPLAVGDRVIVYATGGDGIGEVVAVGQRNLTILFKKGYSAWKEDYHPKQCRRLKVKLKKPVEEKRERVEAYCARFDGDKLGGLYLSKENAEAWLSTVASFHKEIVHLVELRSDEVLIDQKRLSEAWSKVVRDGAGNPYYTDLVQALGFPEDTK